MPAPRVCLSNGRNSGYYVCTNGPFFQQKCCFLRMVRSHGHEAK